MFLSSLIEELCRKEENNKAGCTLTVGGQCIYNYPLKRKGGKTLDFTTL